MHIPVICDRCRAEGAAGDEQFAEIADLLEFEPVPRRAHVNNWTAELQRAFIAALATTGSPRMAARALGRHANGAEQLRNAKGGRGFAAAWDAALELYRERERFRIKDNLAALAEQQEQRDQGSLAHSHLRALPSPSPRNGRGRDPLGSAEWEGEGADQDFPQPDPRSILGSATFDRLIHGYFVKLHAERTARLAGDVVAADFYVRQLTWFEVCLDLASTGGALEAFKDLRIMSDDGTWDCRLVEIAETPASRFLDQARRIYWAEAGEPERPPFPAEDTFDSHDMIAPDGRELTIRTQPSHFNTPRQAADRKTAQERWAKEQVEWETRAIAEHKARSQSDP